MDLIRKSAVGIGLLLCAAAGLGIGYVLQAGQAQDEVVAAPAAAPAPAPKAASAAFGPGRMSSGPARAVQPDAPAPAGTSPFAVDEHGKLVVDEHTETIVDGFIATLSTDNPSADQWQQLEAKVRTGLPDTAAPEAVALVHAYFEYRKEDRLLAPDTDPEGITAMRTALDQKMSLRRKYFKPELADVLFGVRETQLRYSLEVARVAADPALDPLSKQQSIRALHAALPPRVAAQEVNAADGFSAELEEKIALLRIRNAPDEEIARTRAQYAQAEEPKPEPAAAAQGDTQVQQAQ